jgi:hypothetical protein
MANLGEIRMKLDAIYDPDKDRIIISYQETPDLPVTTIDVARGHEHHLRYALQDLEMSIDLHDDWEYHVRDEDKNYGS